MQTKTLVTALFLLIATLPSVPARAADVQVVGTKRIIDLSEQRRVLTINATREGGFLLSGIRLAGAAPAEQGSWVLNISPDQKILWEHVMKVNPRPFIPQFSGALPDRGYWFLAVETSTPAQGQTLAAKIATLGADGGESPKFGVSIDSDEQIASPCGIATRTGFVLVGQEQVRNKESLWMRELDQQGRGTWKWAVAEDQGHAIGTSPITGSFTPCRPPVVMSDGSVMWAVHAVVHPTVPNSPAMEMRHPYDHAVFVFQVDARGHEIKRVRHDDAMDGILIPTSSGLVLIESKSPHFQDPGALTLAQRAAAARQTVESGYGVHITWFGQSFPSVVADKSYQTGDMTWVAAAYHTPEGGLLLAGCTNAAGGDVYVAYVGKDGEMSPVRSANPEIQSHQCQTVGFSAGQTRGEALLLMHDVYTAGGRIVTIKYSG